MRRLRLVGEEFLRAGRSGPPILGPALFILSLWVALFGFFILDGYALYFLNFPSSPWVILALAALEFLFAAYWFLGQNPRLAGDPLELAGFLLVVVGVWLYFVYPSWPTLLPPSHSGDAANHAAFVDSIYSSGYLFGSYPAGPALIIATLVHWIGWSPFRLIHLVGSLFVALTAGSIYGLACEMLPERREYKTIALFSVLALFVPWGYFAGLLIDMSYFLTQAASQFFVVAFIWFLNRHIHSFHPAWIFGMAFCLIGISVSWQLWLLVPLVALGLAVLGEWRAGGEERMRGLIAASLLLGALAIFWGTLILTSPELFPAPAHLYNSVGSILSPSVEALGGPFLTLPLLGALLVFRSGYRTRAASIFLCAALLQTLALLVWRFALGLAPYWISKSFFLLILPMALFAVIPLARGMGWAQERIRHRPLASLSAFGVVLAGITAVIVLRYPAPRFSPLGESDLQVAMWAKQHLDTTHVNWIGKKSLLASWIGVGIWGEKYPRDLFVDLLALGPKTFAEWRNDPGWGEYVMTTSRQEMPADPTLKVVYQVGRSAILEKPAAAPVPGPAPIARFGGILELVKSGQPAQTIRAGETISFTAVVKTLSIPANKVVWRLQFRDRQYRSAAEISLDPFDSRFPFQRWPLGTTLTQPFSLKIPAGIEPGEYRLQLGLYYEGTGAALPAQPSAKDSGDVVDLAAVKVALPPVTKQVLGSLTQINASLGDKFLLMGYRIDRASPIRPGDSLALTLYWKCLAATTQDYTVFVHLLDPSGKLRFQQDNAPRGGSYPTSIWSPGEIIPDPYTLTIPTEPSNGNYKVEVGMYQWPSLQRLPIGGAALSASADHLVLQVDLVVAP
jgi:hypothetical protein